MCAAFTMASHSLFDGTNVAGRWRLKAHPYFRQALASLGLAVPKPVRCKSHDTSANYNENRIYVYNAIALPASNVRYNKLFDLLKLIADFYRNGHCNKLAYMGLSSCLAQLKSVKTSTCT